MTQEEKARAYDKVVNKLRHFIVQGVDPLITRDDVQDFFPELKESEDDSIRKELIAIFKGEISYTSEEDNKRYVAWLEKPWEPKEYTFKSLPRLLEMIEPTERAKAYCQQLIDSLIKEGYATDAKIVGECLKQMNGEDVPMAIMDGKKGEQKSADKAEPKFKVGDWITNGNAIYHISNIRDDGFYCFDYGPSSDMIQYIDNTCHLWNIDDATDGDVLSYVTDEDDLWIMIYWSLYKPYEGHVHYHALLVNNDFSDKGTCCICIDNLKPATKEQCDLLFSKMKEAGYEWDSSKKQLQKIEDVPPEEFDGEDYGIDSLWHAQRILEKTLGKVEGYQSDDGVLEHKCAISAVNKLYKQKSAWSEEDEKMVKDIIAAIDTLYYHGMVNWLKSIKDRVQSRPTWSEEDKIRLDRICKTLWKNRKGDTDEIYQQEQDIDWLRSIKQRTEEQQ